MAVVTKAASSAVDGSVPSGTDLGQWATESNAFATTGDNTYTTAVLGTSKNTGRASRFGFPAFTTSDIPDGSAINSVTVTVEWRMSAAVTGSTLGVQLHNPGGTTVGTETTKTTATEAQSTQQVTSGITLTDLRTAGTVVANVRYTKGNTSTDTTGNLDFVSLSVDYSVPAQGQVSFAELEMPAAPTAVQITPASLTHTRAQGAPVIPALPASLVHTRAQGAATVSPKLLLASIVHNRGLGVTSVLLLQFIRPDADLATGGWTPTPSTPTTLFDKVNDQSGSTLITGTAS